MSALDRDSSVKLRGMLELPAGSFRLFMVASVIGTWVPVDGHPRKLKDGERPIATEVRPTHRDKALELLGLSKKTWHNAVTEWTGCRMAHRCSRGIVCLFISRLGGELAICPRCSALLSRETGSEVPGSRDNMSPETGTSLGRKAAASSENSASAGKLIYEGGIEGGEASAEDEDAAALKRLYQMLGARRASA